MISHQPITSKQPSRPMPPTATRFKMSALGAARCPRLAERQGVIIGAGRYLSSVRVIFDGFKSPMSLHRDYVELVTEHEVS